MSEQTTAFSAAPDEAITSVEKSEAKSLERTSDTVYELPRFRKLLLERCKPAGLRRDCVPDAYQVTHGP